MEDNLTEEQQKILILAKARLRLQQQQAQTATPATPPPPPSPAPKYTDIQWSNPNDIAGQVYMSQLDPNAHIEGLKGLAGLPKDLSSVKPPSLLSAIMNSPINPLMVPMKGVEAGIGLGQNLVNTPSNLASADPYRVGQGLQGVLTAASLGEASKGGAEALKDALIGPSKKKVGTKFEYMQSVGGDVPFPAEAKAAADKALAKALEAKNVSNEQISPPLRAYQRLTKPVDAISGAPEGFPSQAEPPTLTYKQTFKMASRAKDMSAAANSRLSGGMKAINNEFIDALQTGNRAAMETKGLGSLFDEAMVDYARAASREAAMNTAVKYAKRAALIYAAGKIFGAGAGRGTGNLVDALTGR